MRKDQEPVLTENLLKKICKKIITENVKPGKKHLLHNVRPLRRQSQPPVFCELGSELHVISLADEPRFSIYTSFE